MWDRLTQIFSAAERSLNERLVERYRQMAEQVDARMARTARFSNTRLGERVRAFRESPGSLNNSPDALVDLFAIVREAACRAVGQRPYPVQIMAGLALAEGHFAEMATGEGKTLAAIFPVVYYAIQGKGVHLCTVNSYLAKRDHQWMAPVYQLLDLTCGFLPEGWDRDLKRRAYNDDITYGTGYEYGFDLLRDQLAIMDLGQPKLGEALRTRFMGGPEKKTALCQRGHPAVIIDEADSVLADEALLPLILTRTGDRKHPHPHIFHAARDFLRRLVSDDYFLEPGARRVEISPAGLDKIYSQKPPLDPRAMVRAWHTYVELALHAQFFLRRDVDYVVKEDRVWLVDQNTGRLFKDRKWRDGVHQSVEAKEALPVTEESPAMVSIARQEFYKMYNHLCGMSGTLMENRREFGATYGRKVVVIPLHRECRRINLKDRIFKTAREKLEALVKDVLERRRTGQPILIGTKSILSSERIASALKSSNVAFALLNAKQDAEEAAVVARAGLQGSVTIATNMAGRGTDIPLGPGAVAAGGLHVIGAERQESRRLDRQLAGRGARQGDPGSAQFFISAEDDVIVRFKPALQEKWRSLPVDDRGELPEACAQDLENLQAELEDQFARMRQDAALRERWLDKMRETL